MREEDGRRVDWANSVKLLRPVTIADAVAALSGEAEARCLAGGQTLVAMMNADLLRPSALVSLRHIEAMHGVSAQQDGAIRIGAMATHAEIAAFAGFRGGQRIIGAAARRIAHAPIRNAGTIGGSIAHGDPAADFPTALIAADAEISVAGPQGMRRIAAANFFLDFLQTALEASEVVVAIHIPPAPADARSHYEKLTRIDGDFAIVSAGVVLAEGADGRCSHARLVAGACGPTPIRSAAAEAWLVGSRLGAEDREAAAELLAAACNPIDDFRGSAAYRRKVLPRLITRAIEAAWGAVQ